MRKKFIETLTAMVEKDKDLVVLLGDLGFGVFDDFRKKFPKQFINMGIAEQNMIGVAAGLAMTGKHVIVYSIIPFVTFRCLEQIRNDLCYQNLNVVIVGVGAGCMYCTSGSSHHATEDIGIMNTLPNMTILSPSTEQEVEACTKNLFKVKGPVYMRLGKLLGIKEHLKRYFSFGDCTWYGDVEAHVDVTLITTGEILNNVLEVMELLNNRGLKCNIISIHMLKQIDEGTILAAGIKSKVIVTVEEHNIINGLGSIVADVLIKKNISIKLLKIGIDDEFVHEVGSINHIRNTLKLSVKDIFDKVLECMD